jgi:hypothetical protein
MFLFLAMCVSFFSMGMLSFFLLMDMLSFLVMRIFCLISLSLGLFGLSGLSFVSGCTGRAEHNQGYSDDGHEYP